MTDPSNIWICWRKRNYFWTCRGPWTYGIYSSGALLTLTYYKYKIFFFSLIIRFLSKRNMRERSNNLKSCYTEIDILSYTYKIKRSIRITEGQLPKIQKIPTYARHFHSCNLKKWRPDQILCGKTVKNVQFDP